MCGLIVEKKKGGWCRSRNHIFNILKDLKMPKWFIDIKIIFQIWIWRTVVTSVQKNNKIVILLNCQLDTSRVTWQRIFSERLSGSGWPVAMSVGTNLKSKRLPAPPPHPTSNRRSWNDQGTDEQCTNMCASIQYQRGCHSSCLDGLWSDPSHPAPWLPCNDVIRNC